HLFISSWQTFFSVSSRSFVSISLVTAFFFFHDTATTEIYTLSLHDALPIYDDKGGEGEEGPDRAEAEHQERTVRQHCARSGEQRSEEHTSELQSRGHLVCRLLLEKKKKRTVPIWPTSISREPSAAPPAPVSC